MNKIPVLGFLHLLRVWRPERICDDQSKELGKRFPLIRLLVGQTNITAKPVELSNHYRGPDKTGVIFLGDFARKAGTLQRNIELKTTISYSEHNLKYL